MDGVWVGGVVAGPRHWSVIGVGSWWSAAVRNQPGVHVVEV